MNVVSPSPKRSMASFKWEDALLLDDQLTEDERMIREAAHGFCQEKLFPRVLMAIRAREIRPRDHERDGRDGLPGRHPADDYGGAGAAHVAYGLIAREVEGWIPATAGALACSPRWSCIRSRPSARKSRSRIACRSWHRRDARLLRPDRARRRLRPGLHEHPGEASGRRLLLNGAKSWITNRRSPTWPWSGPSTTRARSAASWSSAA